MYLSAGHSNVDPGACANNRREADIVEDFRNMVSHYLTAAGIKHSVDATGTNNLPLADTVKQLKGHNIALEFHCNAGPESAGGVETLSAAKDMALACELCDVISRTLQIKNRGAKPEDSGQHHRLAFVQAGGIIVELFFISSKSDLAAYDARKWLAAKAVASVLASRVGVQL